MSFAFICPLLEYSNSVWDNCSNEANGQLESFHYGAAKIIAGGTKFCSLEKIVADLGWDSLQECHTRHMLWIFYKIVNNLSPKYLLECIPPHDQDGNPYRHMNSSDNRTIYNKSK